MKIAVIGGGSTYTPELVNGLIAQAESLSLDELWLMDIDRERLDVVGGRIIVQGGRLVTVHGGDGKVREIEPEMPIVLLVLTVAMVQQVVPCHPLEDLFGASLANVGDVDGDGKPELTVSSYEVPVRTTLLSKVTISPLRTGLLKVMPWILRQTMCSGRTRRAAATNPASTNHSAERPA